MFKIYEFKKNIYIYYKRDPVQSASFVNRSVGPSATPVIGNDCDNVNPKDEAVATAILNVLKLLDPDNKLWSQGEKVSVSVNSGQVAGSSQKIVCLLGKIIEKAVNGPLMRGLQPPDEH